MPVSHHGGAGWSSTSPSRSRALDAIQIDTESKNMSATKQRDKALSALELVLTETSRIYRESYLSLGKGALLLYADSVINGHIPSMQDYRNRKDILELFDNIDSKTSLAMLLNEYEPSMEGILVLITSFSNATFFVKVKLKSRRSQKGSA